jgi:hypothetical protein
MGYIMGFNGSAWYGAYNHGLTFFSPTIIRYILGM